jgi:hypothetical protein
MEHILAILILIMPLAGAYFCILLNLYYKKSFMVLILWLVTPYGTYEIYQHLSHICSIIKL